MNEIIVSNINHTPALTGRQVCSMMRQNKIVIRDLAAQYGLTIKRIRQVRNNGVQGGIFAADWIKMLTGRWPDAPIAV